MNCTEIEHQVIHKSLKYQLQIEPSMEPVYQMLNTRGKTEGNFTFIYMGIASEPPLFFFCKWNFSCFTSQQKVRKISSIITE
jgi:hypothetical protein